MGTKLASFLLLFLSIFFFLSCQVKDETLHTDSRRAEKKYKTAKKAYKERGRTGGKGRRRSGQQRERKDRRKTVRKNLKKAIDIDPDFLDAHTLLADYYREAGKKEKALEHYRKVKEIDPSFHPEVLFILGSHHLSEGNYEKAANLLKEYKKMEGRRKGLKAKTDLKLASAEFAQKALKDTVPFDPVNMGKGVNSKDPEYFPCLTVDQRVLLFTRRIEDAERGGHIHEDFFSSVKRKGEWQRARGLKAPINSAYNEGAPTLSPDGNLLIFTGCAVHGGYGPGRRGKGSCDLFATKKRGNQWVPPQNLGGPINTRHWETQPSMAPDGKTLYFIRGVRTPKGKEQDIYKSQLKGDGKWSEPRKLSSTVNTPFREESVFIHPDGRTLYFSSNGHPGMGGLDIFYSRKGPDGNWSEPKNLGYPINTHEHENSLLVAPNGKDAYFGSDREGGYGSLDLYRFQLPEEVRADPVTYLRGKLVDAKTGKPLDAEFKLKDLNTGELITSSRSDEKNGSFLVPLPTGRKYALSVDRKGYLFHSENFVLDEEKGGKEKAVKKNIELQPIDTGKSVVLENVFFETAKYDLKKESRVELNKLYRFLERNPSLKIEIQGHTDSVGSKKDNQVLSENRAQAVYDYLKKKGIPAGRMKAKGYGERRPIADNSTPEGRARNRRTAYEIIGK